MSAGRAPRLLQALTLRARSGLLNSGSLQAGAERGGQVGARLPPINHFAAGLRASHLTREQEICLSTDQEPISEDVAQDRSAASPGRNSGPSSEPTVEDGVKPPLGDEQDPSSRHDLAMVFTCNVCEVRSAKTMNRASYEKGVVIVRCPGCKNLHLISDRLGWFGEPGSVEDFLAQKGVAIRTGNDETYQFSMEDLTGWTPNKAGHDGIPTSSAQGSLQSNVD